MGAKTINVSDNLLCIPFPRYAVITVSLPAFSLAYCFFSAFFFRYGEINDTDCNVTNTIPSVSAVTGIRPQAYVWRICIGLHSAPRFFVGFMYFNLYKNSLPFIQAKKGLYKFFMHLCFWLYTVECSCLLAVSCISNKENYPIHEKIFVVFMVASVAHMVFGTYLFNWSKSHREMTQSECKSYFWKKVMLLWISSSTVGLLWFFYLHRIHCIPGAFSYFSVCEYMIAYANMGYHITGYLEFKDKFLLAGRITLDKLTNGELSQNSLHPIRNGKKKVQ